MSFKIAKSRYKSIEDRSFETYIDLFLIRSYLDNSSLKQATLQSFESFNYNDARIKECLKAYQLPSDNSEFQKRSLKELDKAIELWHDNHNLKDYKEHFCKTHLISESEFMEFYGMNDQERTCGYCKINEDEFGRIIDKELISTKRLSTRGRTMEVDQMDPNKGYRRENLILTCYWCNNAKTDEFTYKEFIPIGESIGQIFRDRLDGIAK